ncbi:hypothetical protein [Enhygromyxa salina]|uniref:hypothetical protein n=1 Tax=Enhygromyxa salina TaxID=215803 RepID=UPI000697F834|nr:hypothetical protein [Enhygromyxa salina]
MTIVLIDADAFLCARKLELIELLRSSPELWPKPSLYCTSIVARNELNDLQSLIGELEALGLFRVERVLAKTPAARMKREIQSRLRVHKGEAEAIAWGIEARLTLNCVVAFVSLDAEARRAATASKLAGWDLFDLGRHWLERGLLSKSQFRSVFEAWEDGPHVFGRPRDFEGLEATFQSRFGVSLADFPSPTEPAT